jgi:hypothetical protein
MLTVSDVSKLIQKDKRTIKRYCEQGSIRCSKQTIDKHNFKYLIPLESLPQDLQDKWTAMQAIETVEVKTGLESLSEAEREQVDEWLALYDEFQIFKRGSQLKKTEAMIEFGVLHQISKGTLYRRFKAVEVRDYAGLIDRRGKVKRKWVNREVVERFFDFYLHQNKRTIAQSAKLARHWCEQNRPDLLENFPSVSTFKREVDKLPQATVVLAREGEKACRDLFGLYVTRVYDKLEANDVWVGDTHTLDLMALNEDGKTVTRLYLSAWQDMRSGVVVGYHIGTSSSSSVTIKAFRNGIENFGIPREVYVDNGREFLNMFFGGLGHRQKKSTKDAFTPPPILKRLGINMVNAIVRNARAKPVERWFLNVKEGISKLYESYTGGTVLEKPERLKQVLKSKQGIPTIAEVQAQLSLLIEYGLNLEGYGGAVVRDHHKRKIDVFNENMKRKRIVPTAEELNLLLMKTVKPLKVGRIGIRSKLSTLESMTFYDEAFVREYIGQAVYLRYDEEDLSEVRVYDLDDRFICTLKNGNALIADFRTGAEEIKALQREIRKRDKFYKEELNKVLPNNRAVALDVALAEAERQKVIGLPKVDAKVIEMVRALEHPQLAQHAIGQDFEQLDFGKFADVLENREDNE